MIGRPGRGDHSSSSSSSRVKLYSCLPFYRLLELNPDIQDTFPSFRGVALDELMNSRSLFLHSKRLMAAVEKAISSLEDGQEIVERLTDLGQRHIAISITEKHFKVRKACQRKHVQT